MNSKKTNYLIAVMNVIAIVSFYLLYFSSNYLTDTMMISSNGAKNIYNNNIIEFLLLNIKPIMIILSLSIAIPNIVSAIQNKKDKKLSFWQLVFGVYNLSAAVDIAFLEYSDVKKWEHIIMFIVIPIILVIKNFITIKKDKPTKLKIVSYMLAIIIAIIEIFNCLFNFLGTGTLWSIIAIIMQFIYIHNQENTNVESKGRKVFNIILYYIIQTIVVVSLFIHYQL